MTGCYQALNLDVDKIKNLVSECVDLADKMRTSAVCSEVARISLNKQLNDFQERVEEVDHEWCKKRTELETELTHHENYYNCYQVCGTLLMMLV